MSVAKKVVKGGIWSTLSKIIQQCSGVVVNIILARLLIPDDFGLVAMVNVYIAFVSIFTRAGFGAAVIYEHKATQEQISSLHWLNMLINVASFAIIVGLAPLAGWFYNEPRVNHLVRILALNALIVPLFSIHRSLMERDLKFMLLAKIDMAAVLGSAVVGIASAAIGCEVYSLILKTISLNLIYLMLVRWKSSWNSTWVLSLSSIKELVLYGLKFKGARVANYFERNIDYIILGKVFNPTILGYYSFAYNIMYFPVKRISYIFTQILFPAFSAIKDQPQKIKDGYLRSIQFISLASFPFMMYVGVMATPLIIFVFGEKWMPVSKILTILAAAGALQTIDQLSGVLYPAVNKVNVLLSFNTFKMVLTGIAVLIGSLYGLLGVAVGILCVKILSFTLNQILLKKFVQLAMLDVARTVRGPVIGCLSMLLIDYALNYVYASESSLPMFCIHSLGLWSGYLMSIYFTNWKDVKYLYSVLKTRTR